MVQVKIFLVALLLPLNQVSALFSNDVEDIERSEAEGPAREVDFTSKGSNVPKAFFRNMASDFNRLLNDVEAAEPGAWHHRSDITPTNVKDVKLFNKRGFLAVNKYGEVYSTAKNGPEAEFKIMLYSLSKKTYKVRLENVKYSKYIAISCKNGNVYTTDDRKNPETVLVYSPGVDSSSYFQSEKCAKGSNFWYIGIKKDGRIKNAKLASGSDAGTRFLLLYSLDETASL